MRYWSPRPVSAIGSSFHAVYKEAMRRDVSDNSMALAGEQNKLRLTIS